MPEIPEQEEQEAPVVIEEIQNLGVPRQETGGESRGIPEQEGEYTPEGIIDPVPKILPGREVHILSGSSGAGKTSLVGWLVSRIQNDQSIFGHPCNIPPFIAYMSSDRNLRDAVDKFKIAGWRDPVVYGLVNDQGSGIDDTLEYMGDRKRAKNAGAAPDRLALLWRGLESLRARYYPNQNRLPEDSMLIVDGMAAFTGVEPAGAYLRSVAVPLIILNRFCWQHKFTMLLIHHSAKQVGDAKARYVRPQDRILGSMALQGYTSTQMFLTEPELTECPEKNLHELTIRSHSAAPEMRNLRRHEKTGAFGWADPLVTGGVLAAPPARPRPTPTPISNHIPKPATAIMEHVPEDGSPILKSALQFASGQSKTAFYRNLGILLENKKLEEAIQENLPAVRRPAPTENQE